MSDKAIYTIELNDKLSPGLKKAVSASLWGWISKWGKLAALWVKAPKAWEC